MSGFRQYRICNKLAEVTKYTKNMLNIIKIRLNNTDNSVNLPYKINCTVFPGTVTQKYFKIMKTN